MSNPLFDRSKKLLCEALDFSGSPEELEALKRVNEYHLEHFPNGEAVKREKENRIITSQNSKVGKKVLILNLTPAIRCKESMDGHCAVQKQIIDDHGVRDGKINCYALRAEWQYVNKFQNSLWNYIMVHEKSADEIAGEILEDIGRKNINHIRFNENGCFATPEIADKAMEVAKILKEHGVHSYSYTSDPEMYSRIEGSDIVINLSNGDVEDGKNTKVVFPTRENALVSTVRTKSSVVDIVPLVLTVRMKKIKGLWCSSSTVVIFLKKKIYLQRRSFKSLKKRLKQITEPISKEKVSEASSGEFGGVRFPTSQSVGNLPTRKKKSD